MKKICILGAGSWGTALAINCSRIKKQTVYLWGHQSDHIENLKKHNENKQFLAGHKFADNLVPTNNLAIVAECEMILLVVPSSAFREVLEKIQPYIKNQKIGWAIKGFDSNTNDFLSKTFTGIFKDKNFAIIAGPSFAKEVAKGLPTAITVASTSQDFATNYANYLHNETMRIYTSTDIIGVQLGGALKNVIAIATGIADGIGFGANTRAALITRGLKEISRISEKTDANLETLMGLSGLGDLILTCTDSLSRNRRLGILIGQGKTAKEAQEIIGQTVEGVNTVIEAKEYIAKNKVHAPIIETVYQIIQENISATQAVEKLIASKTKPENL